MPALFASLSLLPVPQDSKAAAGRTGALVVAGGGDLPDALWKKMVALTGKTAPRAVVIPNASKDPDAGDGSVAELSKAGASDVRKVRDFDGAEGRQAIEQADLVWFSGGDQVRLMETVPGTKLADALRRKIAAGAVVGGSSAGAAVMSLVMLTGKADRDTIKAGATETKEGLGLWPGVIVDQHFVKRARANRLLSVVLDHPELVGVGIDEATAVVVQGRACTVMGEGNVLVVDARKASREPLTASRPSAGRGLTVSVLRDGMTFEL